MKTVTLMVRYVDSRQAFHPSTLMAWLETPNGTVMGTTRGHETWIGAATAALTLAKRRGFVVSNEAAVLGRIASGS